MKIAITGAKGLIGWHAAARLHAQNCAARYRNEPPPHEIVQIDLDDSGRLASLLEGVDGILHFAGVNRGEEAEVERGNPDIARELIGA